MRPLQSAFYFPLRCTVFLLNADPYLLTWLYTSLSAGLPRWSFLALLPLVLQARLAPIPRLPILAVWSCSRPLSLSLKLVCCRLEICNIVPGECAAVCSRSASLHPATELRSARGRATACSGPCCEHRLGHLCLPLHLRSHCSFLRDLDLFLKLFDITSTRNFPWCPHFTWDISLVELEMQISRRFSHAPGATERQCPVPKAASQSCW